MRAASARAGVNRFADEVVRIEITRTKLSQLVTSGALYGVEFRCLDCASKRCLWRLFLENSSEF